MGLGQAYLVRLVRALTAEFSFHRAGYLHADVAVFLRVASHSIFVKQGFRVLPFYLDKGRLAGTLEQCFKLVKFIANIFVFSVIVRG